jgi:hypothetical protein
MVMVDRRFKCWSLSRIEVISPVVIGDSGSMSPSGIVVKGFDGAGINQSPRAPFGVR